jgi:hypothetical protein
MTILLMVRWEGGEDEGGSGEEMIMDGVSSTGTGILRGSACEIT